LPGLLFGLHDAFQVHILHAIADPERAMSATGLASETHLDSSMADDGEPIEAVKGKPQRAINTILPIALLVGGVSMATCSIPVAFGMPWWLGLTLGAAGLFSVLRLLGQRVNREVKS
jgi:hypothetical protein